MTPRRQYSESELQRLFTTELAASFAISPNDSSGLVAHVHWQGQQPVHSWADVQRLHDESRYWPCFFDGAYGALVARDGQPPVAFVHRLFGDVPEGPSSRMAL